MKKSEFSERIQALLDQTLEEGSPSRAVATNKTKTLKPKHDAWYRTAEGRIIRICDDADKNLPFVGGDQDGEAKSYTKDGTPFGNDPDWRLVEEIVLSTVIVLAISVSAAVTASVCAWRYLTAGHRNRS